MQTKACSKCKEERDISLFQLYKGKPNGQCRLCKTASEKIRREHVGIPVKKLSKIKDNQKLCVCCNSMKALSDFSPTPRGLGGLSAYCKPCLALKARQRGAAKETTAAYRARHPERYKVAHRLYNFERHTLKKVTADGSVTDKFLEELFKQTHCFYCAEEVVKNKKTVDHRVALSKGGTHTSDNLVMACWSCNSSKKDMSEEDFIKRMQNDNLSKNN